MTQRKTDVLNLRLDPSLSEEIDRIAERRKKSASEVARDLLQYGVAVERDLEAAELRMPYTAGPVDRDAVETRVVIEGKFLFYSRRELEEFEAQAMEDAGF